MTRNVVRKTHKMRPLNRTMFAYGFVALGFLHVGGEADANPTSVALWPIDRVEISTPSGPRATGHTSLADLRVCETEAPRLIEDGFSRWMEIVTRGTDSAAADAEVVSIVANGFALELMGTRILGSRRWARLDENTRRQVVQAVANRLAQFGGSYLGTLGPDSRILPADEELVTQDGTLRSRYWIVSGNTRRWISFYLEPTGGRSGCKIVDVGTEEGRIVDHLHDQADDLYEDYSTAYVIAELGGYDYLVLEDFESSSRGELPTGWTWRDQDDDENKPYRIEAENGNQYLKATDTGESVILGKELTWDLNKYPYISFRVRVHEIPVGADERDDRRVDSAAGLYFTYRKKFLGKIPESVKYVWSSTLPVGSAVLREGIGRPWQIVFESGTEELGEWKTYVFDLRQAYRETFGGTPPSKPIGIGVLSDANSMNARAYADYDDIRALRVAPPGTTSGVRQILEPVK